MNTSPHPVNASVTDMYRNMPSLDVITPQLQTELQIRSEEIEKIILEHNLVDESKELFLKLAPELALNKLVNAVSPVFTGKELDLNLVESRAKELNLAYSKSTGFVGISVKLVDPEFKCKYTAIFFRSGSVNCVGLSSDAPEYLAQCTALLKKYCGLIFGNDFSEQLQMARKITNRVYTIHLKDYKIQLQQLKKLNRWRDCKYVNEAFPGAIIDFPNNPATKKSKLLLFNTGKLIFTGIKNHLTKFEVERELLKFFGDIVAYKMNNPASEIITYKATAK